MKKLRTHYDNLQIKENASPEVIKRAYLFLSYKWYPDNNPTNRQEAERVYKIINDAYRILSDPDKRKEHDEWINKKRMQNTEKKPEPEKDIKTTNTLSEYSTNTPNTSNSLNTNFLNKALDYLGIDPSGESRDLFEKVGKQTMEIFSTEEIYVVGFLLFLAYSIAQVVAGYVGIDFYLGAAWAVIAIIAAFMFRFTLPITIGAFFGAMDVWGWHWALAALFAAPGLAFIIPGVILSIIEDVRK